MAKTVSNSSLRPQVWAKNLFTDAIANLYFMVNGMMGTDANNIVQVQEDLEKQKGDRVNFKLTKKLSGAGVSGDTELEGMEEKQNFHAESVLIDQKRNAIRLEGTLDEQINGYEMREEAKEGLRVWLTEFIERQFFLKLGGVTNTGLTDVNGTVVGTDCAWSNTPDFIPNADEAAGVGNRYLCANTGGTDVIASTDKITPDLIDRAKAKALTSDPKIMPLMINSKPYYVLFVHPWQLYDLRRNAEWAQAMREAERRGEENPIFSGAEGVWNGVIIHAHEYVPFLNIATFSGGSKSFRGASGSDANANIFRALFCGRQAVGYAKAKNLKKEWVEKNFDYDNQYGVATSLLGGVQKLVFNSIEYGVIAIDTAATALNG